MRHITVIGAVIGWLGLCCWPALGQGDPNPKRRETLSALYMARWTETVCGFRFNERERAALADAISFIEGRLTDPPAQKKELDARAKTFVEQNKAKRDCEPSGGFDKLVRKMIADLPDPEPVKTTAPR